MLDQLISTATSPDDWRPRSSANLNEQQRAAQKWHDNDEDVKPPTSGNNFLCAGEALRGEAFWELMQRDVMRESNVCSVKGFWFLCSH